MACYRCYKSANIVINQPNFGGFSDFDDWFIERDIDIIREKANEWKNCTTEESRKAHVSQHHVRWSEIYNLHYFNPVRHCVVDPMHCLFLGIAKWIVTKLWIGEGSVGMGHCPREFLMSQTVPVQGHVPDCPKLSHLKILLNYI